jgi:CP family cyanate transporter-like MFS transporter
MDANTTIAKRYPWLLLLGIVVVAINLRPAIASVPPVLETIQDDIGLSYTTISLLTAIPTLCMGIFALAVPSVINKFGRERGVFWGIVLIAASTVVRISSDLVIVLFGSTISVGIGIAITQALLPSLVTEYFNHQKAFATGLYTAGLTGGGAIASGATAPIGDLFDSWPLALAVWALPAILAVPIWYLCWKQYASIESGATTPNSTQATLPWRNRWAVFITVYFGAASIVYFLVLTWLVPRYVAYGWSTGHAGLLLMLFFLTQLAGNLLISVIGDRVVDQRPLFSSMALLIICGALGVAYLPEYAPLVWVIMLGTGTGGLFTLNLTLPVIYADGATATDGLSSMMFGGGNLISVLGPSVGGLLRDITGSFTIAFASTALLASLLLVGSILFNPDREQITTGTSVTKKAERA